MDFFKACQTGDIELVKEYLAEGFYINTIDELDCTPLIRASAGGHVEIIKLLLERNPDVHLKDKAGWTALHYATYFCDFKIAKLLFEYSVSADIKSKYNKSALQLAFDKNFYSLLLLFRKFDHLLAEDSIELLRETRYRCRFSTAS